MPSTLLPRFGVGNVLYGNVIPLVFILSWCVSAKNSAQFQKNIPAKHIWAVENKDIELPCDVTPPLPDDDVSMIFWFKDTSGMPFYSLDGRDGSKGVVSHLAMSDDLGSRSYFIMDEGHPSEARLRIQNMKYHDEGVYRCRVDFNNSPTRNFQVNLTLVVQPSEPRIFDAEGREIKGKGPTGPFLEGSKLFLSCQVSGGRPRPTLIWYHNDTVLDAVIDSDMGSLVTVNQLDLDSVPRSLKGARIQCRASSSRLADDVTREISVIVYLKPNKIKIVTPNRLLSSQKPESFKCETSGSYPPAKLSWLLNGRPIREGTVTEEETATFTASILSLSVSSEDDGKDLVCRADNPRFPGGYAEDRRQIHVAYPPKVSVKLDSEIGTPAIVNEGSEVRLICQTTARPTPYSYSWYHDGHLVPYNETAGILPEDQELTLKHIQRPWQGQYACSATNTEGETYSAPFDLTVQFAPRCSPGHSSLLIGAMPYEPLTLECNVDAAPEVTRFRWTYNTSKLVAAVQGGAKMHNTGFSSVLHFTPPLEDLHSLSCWAANSVGNQEMPCVFYIVPAGRPESPSGCLVREAATHGGMEVACMAGNDGGLRQSFVLEVTDVSMATGPTRPLGSTTLSDQGERAVPTPMYRVLGEQPRFKLHSLEPGKEYRVEVYAENAKGRSTPPVILPRIRVDSDTSKQTIGFPSDSTELRSSVPSLTLIITALATAAVLLIAGIVTVATVIACRSRSRSRSVRNSTAGSVVLRKKGANRREDCELSEAGFGADFHRRSAQYRASMYGPQQEVEERISRMVEGPDLILSPVSFSQHNNDY